MQNIYIFILSMIFLALIPLIIKSKQRIQTKRLFIALDIPYTYKLGINKVQKFLKRRISDFKEENPHTTLIFLGDTHVNHIEKIKTAIENTLNELRNNSKLETYTLQPGAKIFGKNAIVLEYARTNSLNDLKNLVKNLAKNLEQTTSITNAQSKEIINNFKAHLTLGRFNASLDDQNLLLLDQIKVPIDQKTHGKDFSPKSITLYESKNNKYIPLQTYKLQ